VLILASTVRTHHSTVGIRSSRSGGLTQTYASLWRSLHGLFRTLFVVLVFGIVLFALFSSLVTVFVGTISQLLGVYGNCMCSISVSEWVSPTRDSAQLNLATDTLLHREMSMYWSGAGYAAIAFLGIMTYLGWYYQRALKKSFEAEIERLAE